jgi:hypothetical protein
VETRGINWLQIVATAAITGVIAVIAGMVLFWLQTKEPALVFEAAETHPFTGTSGRNFAIYNVSIANPGRAAIPDVVGVVQVPGGLIDDLRIDVDPALGCTYTVISDTLEMQLAELAPGETARVSVLATSGDELPNTPNVSVRGSGIVGVGGPTIGSNRSASPSSIVWPALIGAYGGLMTLVLSRRGYLWHLISSKHSGSGEQHEVLAYLCGLHGLMDDQRDYLSRSGHTSYWAEADRFGALAVADPESEEAAKRKAVLVDLLECASIVGSSVGIIHYNIARIAASQGDQDEARDHVSRARKHGRKLIEGRLRLDRDLREAVGSVLHR